MNSLVRNLNREELGSAQDHVGNDARTLVPGGAKSMSEIRRLYLEQGAQEAGLPKALPGIAQSAEYRNACKEERGRRLSTEDFNRHVLRHPHVRSLRADDPAIDP